MRQSHQTWVVRIIAVVVMISGIVAIVAPLAQRIPERFEDILPTIDINYASRSLQLLIGLTVLYLGIQLWQRKVVAWGLSMAAMVILLGLNLTLFRSPGAAVVFSLTLLLLLGSKSSFKARSEVVKIRKGILLFMASILVALTYGTAGFYLLDRRDFGIDFGLRESAVRSLQEYTSQGNADLHPHSHHAKWFLDSLRLLGATSMLFGLYSLFRPLDYEYAELPEERRRVAGLLEKYSTSTDDYFKLWPHDKSYFFARERHAAVAYGVAANVAMAVGDPVGSKAGVGTAIAQFSEFCLSHGWSPCFMYTGGANRKVYEAAGFELLKIGEDAVVDLDGFAVTTARNKHFRNIRNRFDKDGFTVNAAMPPHSSSLLDELAAVSDAWLAQPDRKEWQFLSGNFSPQYLAMGTVFVARDGTGRARAFANQLPTYIKGSATIDLMRYDPEAPKGMMDYLLMSVMTQLHDGGYAQFNLGLAPLAGLGQGEAAPVEKLLNLIYNSRQRFVSFQGLRQFKGKFDPAWQSRYVAYQGGIASLPKIAYSLSKLIQKR